MTRQLSCGTATVATGRDVVSPFPPSGNEGYIRNRDVPFRSVTPSHVGDRRIGIPTKAPQELPPPVPCVGLLVLPIRQTVRALHREGRLLLFLEQPKQ